LAQTRKADFWIWFAVGTGGRPGWRRLISRWALIHISIGFIASQLLSIEVSKAAQVVLIPLSGVFVGLTFAWVANVQTILQSDEIATLAAFKKGGYVDYVYSFQLGMFVVLGSIVVWGLAGLEITGALCKATASEKVCNQWITGFLFATVSLSIRECWQLISGSMLLLISRRGVQEIQQNQDEN
jgi:hypothetical protein